MEQVDASVAVLHDRFPTFGGAERVAVEAARVLEAPIYTMYCDDVTVPSDVDVHTINQSKYTSGISGRLLEWKAEGMNPLEPASVGLDMTDAHPNLEAYDVVFTSGPLSKFYVPEPHQTVLNYPHSPPRWLYDQFRDRMRGFDYLGVKIALKAYAQLWRAFDKQANDHIDRFVANSEIVADRIERYYDRDATVVYPPVTGDWRNEGDDGYFITWSRLTPAKRITMIAEAFSDLDEELVIAGDGEQRSEVEEIATENENIDYRGHVEDIESLVARCTAVVYAAMEEDFGMVGAEALTAGKPLIGVDEGFTRHQVKPGVNGVTFEPSVNDLRQSVREFSPSEYDPDEIRSTGTQFDPDVFGQELKSEVTGLL